MTDGALSIAVCPFGVVFVPWNYYSETRQNTLCFDSEFLTNGVYVIGIVMQNTLV